MRRWLMKKVAIFGWLTGCLFCFPATILVLLVASVISATASSSSSTNGLASQAYLPLINRPFSAVCPESNLLGSSDGLPSWGSTITISDSDSSIWVVNPDAGSVSKVDSQTMKKVAEIPAGLQPWSLALSPDNNRIYVLDRAGGQLLVINVQAEAVCAAIPVGPYPGQIALSPGGQSIIVTVTNQDEVVLIDSGSLGITQRAPLSAKPVALAITDDGDGQGDDEKIYVTHQIAFSTPDAEPGTDDGAFGQVTVLDAGDLAILNTIALAPDIHGYPNQLAAVSIFQDRAWVPHIRTAPALPNGLSTKVFAAVAELDLDQDQENFQARILLNDQQVFGSPVNNPLAAVPSPDGQTLYIVLAGSNLVEVVDVSVPGQPALVRFLPTGSNPRGMVVNPDGQLGYVMNYLSRSITVLDLEALAVVAEIPATTETLDPQLLRGKILFNSAADPRISQGSWTSCASCHPDGGTDGATWMLPDGPRQTPPLWRAGLTLPWHWSATLDEAQDVELTIEDLQHGLGLAPGSDPLLLGQPNAGRTEDLDALAAYLTNGIDPQPGPRANGVVTAGRAVFSSAGCASCHGGPSWTSSSLPGPAGTLDDDGNGSIDAVLRDVGTLNPLDVRGQGGFDPPSLLGVTLSSPYLHDGSVPTLEALLDSGHPDPTGLGNGLSDQEKTDLVVFLRSIGITTAPVSPD